MIYKCALEQILNQFIGMNLNDLTQAEQNIMDLACIALQVTMPTNSYAEFTKPKPY
jgi:hypothetical protein